MTETNDLLVRLEKPGRVERIGHDMAQLCKDAAAALRQRDAEIERLRTIENAAQRLSRISTPFNAYDGWRADGNDRDADRLDEWVSAREALQQALTQDLGRSTESDDEVSPKQIADAQAAIAAVVNQADEVIRLIAEAEAEEQAR